MLDGCCYASLNESARQPVSCKRPVLFRNKSLERVKNAVCSPSPFCTSTSELDPRHCQAAPPNHRNQFSTSFII